MSSKYKKGLHTVYDIQYRLVWATKYRYYFFEGEVELRAGELIRQNCEASNIVILSGHASEDHIHLHISSPPELSPDKIFLYLKGRSSRLTQREFSYLRKRYWGNHLWTPGYSMPRKAK